MDHTNTKIGMAAAVAWTDDDARYTRNSRQWYAYWELKPENSGLRVKDFTYDEVKYHPRLGHSITTYLGTLPYDGKKLRNVVKADDESCFYVYTYYANYNIAAVEIVNPKITFFASDDTKTYETTNFTGDLYVKQPDADGELSQPRLNL